MKVRSSKGRPRNRSEAAENDSPAAARRRGVQVVRMALGRGVFALQRYKAESVLGEISGMVIDDQQYGSRYCMDLGDSRCLEPDAPFRFMNHSCEPNCYIAWFDITSVPGAAPRRRMFVIAQADIAKGAEVTIDYAWSASTAIPCRCGAAACRGWIVARSELAAVDLSQV